MTNNKNTLVDKVNYDLQCLVQKIIREQYSKLSESEVFDCVVNSPEIILTVIFTLQIFKFFWNQLSSRWNFSKL